jgi:hypothetical protein
LEIRAVACGWDLQDKEVGFSAKRYLSDFCGFAAILHKELNQMTPPLVGIP